MAYVGLTGPVLNMTCMKQEKKSVISTQKSSNWSYTFKKMHLSDGCTILVAGANLHNVDAVIPLLFVVSYIHLTKPQ